MLFYGFKILITLALIISVAEISKNSSVIGGLVASVPIISVLAMIWLYMDTHDVEKVTLLSKSIFWLVLPSLSLFLSLPVLLNHGVGFWTALGVSLVLMFGCYYLMLIVLQHTGFEI